MRPSNKSTEMNQMIQISEMIQSFSRAIRVANFAKILEDECFLRKTSFRILTIRLKNNLADLSVVC